MADICSNYHGGADTSVEAFEKTTSRPSQYVAIFKLMRETSLIDWTCEECEIVLDIRHATCSARITELVRDGLIRDTGRRRPTSSGRSARVYVAARKRTAADE